MVTLPTQVLETYSGFCIIALNLKTRITYTNMLFKHLFNLHFESFYDLNTLVTSPLYFDTVLP